MSNEILKQLFDIMENTDIQEISIMRNTGCISIVTETTTQDYYKENFKDE